MRIDLRKIKTIFICPDHNEKYNARRKHIEAMLTRHGFENVVFYKSGTENYPHCLRYSVYNILQQNLDNPVFVIEDDIIFHKNPEFIFDIPDDSDAVYFGTAGTCMDFEDTGRNRSVDNRDYEIYNDIFIKIKNMLCAHGILYWSKEYKQQLSKILLDSTMPCDVEMCNLQPLYKIYGLRIPLCWQSTHFNSIDWHEHVTKVRFSETGCWVYDGEEDSL